MEIILSNHIKSSFDDSKKGLMVVVRGNDEKSCGRAIKKFKKMIKDSGLMNEIEKNRFYEKPCLKRKRKKSIAIKRQKKLIAQKLEQYGF